VRIQQDSSGTRQEYGRTPQDSYRYRRNRTGIVQGQSRDHRRSFAGIVLAKGGITLYIRTWFIPHPPFLLKDQSISGSSSGIHYY
jgi:hypothetical protein